MISHKILEYREPLMAYALKLTRNPDEAEDLLQETFTKALANEEKFTEGTNLRAWLYTIMRNTFITQAKTVNRRKTFVDTSEHQYLLNETKPSANYGGSSLVLDEIHAAIDQLSASYQLPFQMFYTGYKYQEIADVLEVPMGTVKNRIHVARRELKRMLKAYQFDRAEAVN